LTPAETTTINRTFWTLDFEDNQDGLPIRVVWKRRRE